ncbi:hypothetical protein NicSoilC5_20960 [Arthrobacter sp. NicSoilC5]|nr:hypothetical protein NicSoilC5_20960 [Arthrobacter sp. NicSoilC5]
MSLGAAAEAFPPHPDKAAAANTLPNAALPDNSRRLDSCLSSKKSNCFTRHSFGWVR